MMSRYQAHNFEIPEETVAVAQAAFPKGNVYMTMRDRLGPLFNDADFAALFSWQGQAGKSPGLLAMVTVMQYMEGLTDRQAAEAVRSRIDWKYALGLGLKDAGFDYSILSPFRARLLAGGQESLLFDRIVERLKEQGLLKDKAQQRTDSTHVLAAVRDLNRLACVGEALRRVLDDVARIAPDWLLSQISSDWFERYDRRFEIYRLPEKQSEKEALQLQIGQDGSALLTAIYSDEAPLWLRELPSVGVMCRIWIQQYYIENDQVQWRDKDNLPPFKLLIVSPDDIEARNRTKRENNWTGYAVHFTETCPATGPHLITNVATTPATTADVEMTGIIHQALADRDLLPDEHLVDAGYTSVDHLLDSRRDYQLDLIGPMAGGGSWQVKQKQGFDVSCFSINWAQQTVTCPQGKLSQSWHIRPERYGHHYIQARFAPDDCRACPRQSDCTRSKRGVRAVQFKPQAKFEALAQARQRQQTDEFKAKYKKRAGIEGTISQGTRSFNLRRSRYIGLAKTHLQHLATAAAMNLTRAVSWWMMDESRLPLYRSPFAKLAPVT
jgi:transposase